MKKLLAIVLCMCMVFSAFPLFVFAENGESDIPLDADLYYVNLRPANDIDLSVYEGLEAPFDFYGLPVNSVEITGEYGARCRVTIDKNNMRPTEAKQILDDLCSEASAFFYYFIDDPNRAVFDVPFVGRAFRVPYIERFHYTLLKTYEELENFLLFCEEDGDGAENEFAEYAKTLDESFFEEKALFIARDISEIGVEYCVDHVYVYEASEVRMEYSYSDIGRKADYSTTYFITAEINQSDIKSVDYIRAEKTLDSEYNIDFEYHYFNQSFTVGEYSHGANYIPKIIKNFSELNEFKNGLSDICRIEFFDYVGALPDDFFEENALILVLAGSGNQGYSYKVTSVTSYDTGITLGYAYSGGYMTATGSTIIAVEIKKADAKNLDNAFSPEVTSREQEELISWESRLESRMLGDVNGDKELDADDYIALKRLFFGTDKYQKYGDITEYRSDVSCDGKIDADDYILLKRVYFGQHSLGE